MMPTKRSTSRPMIGITSDLMIRKDRPTAFVTMSYAHAVVQAGGIPVVLAPIADGFDELVQSFDAFIFSGGDDPQMEPFGQPTHPKAVPVLPDRQQFETKLISCLENHPQIPVLGICLGMQMLALCRGGQLNQHLPDTHPSHEIHWGHEHDIQSMNPDLLRSGLVWSKHRQAVSDPGELEVIATSPDGVIEALVDHSRRFTLGVQWHPERTDNPALGQHLFDQLVQHASTKG